MATTRSAFYRCPFCGVKSSHPKDVANKYCGRCHIFQDDIVSSLEGAAVVAGMRQFAKMAPCPLPVLQASLQAIRQADRAFNEVDGDDETALAAAERLRSVYERRDVKT